MHLLKRVVTRVAAALLLGYLVLALALSFFSRRMIFPVPPAQRLGSLPPELIHLSDCGAKGAQCLYARAPPGGPTLVYFHGNGDQLASAPWLAMALHARGVGMLAVEYPGYSGCPGQPSEAALYQTATRAVAFLRETLHVPEHETVLLGQSLGTGVATELAHRGIGTRLILVSPFTSIPDVGQRVLPWLPVRWLVRDRFDSLSKAGHVHQPTLVLHGTRDEVVPFDLGKTLAGAIRGAHFEPVPGAGHNDIFDHPGVVEAIAAFARGETLVTPPR